MKHFKVLHLVRHAKSSWEYDGIADIDRTLKPKGIRNAYEISRKLKLNNDIPDLVISSPANRAMHTAVIFARVLDFPLTKLEINSILYESSIEKIMDMIRKFNNEYHSAMIFGHNPDFTDVVNTFLTTPIDSIPTAGVVTLKFNSADWKGVNSNNLENYLFNFSDQDE